MMARIIAVADTLDAITTNRPYQSAMDLDFALERIRSLAVAKFDPQVVAALEYAIAAGRLRLPPPSSKSEAIATARRPYRRASIFASSIDAAK